MHFGTFLVLALVALVAGFVYNWLTPKLTPMLPAVATSNIVLRSVATGVFILIAIAIAHWVAKAVVGKKAAAARVGIILFAIALAQYTGGGVTL